MSGRFSRGLAVVDRSLDLFRARPSLALLPLCSLLLVGSGFAIATGLALHYGVLAAVVTSDVVRYAAVFVGFAVATGLGTFFNAAVVYCAARHFDGETPSAREGLAAAWEVRRRIATWAVVAATVGTAMYVIDEKFGGLGTLARLGFDLAWSLLTFFVVPVIVLEDEDDLSADLRASGSAFRDTWGESVTVSFGIGLAMLPVVLAGCGAFVWAYLGLAGWQAWLVGGTGFLVVVAAIVGSQVLGAIARTALYRYATGEERVGPLTDLDPGQFVSED